MFCEAVGKLAHVLVCTSREHETESAAASAAFKVLDAIKLVILSETAFVLIDIYHNPSKAMVRA